MEKPTYDIRQPTLKMDQQADIARCCATIGARRAKPIDWEAVADAINDRNPNVNRISGMECRAIVVFHMQNNGYRNYGSGSPSSFHAASSENRNKNDDEVKISADQTLDCENRGKDKEEEEDEDVIPAGGKQESVSDRSLLGDTPQSKEDTQDALRLGQPISPESRQQKAAEGLLALQKLTVSDNWQLWSE